MEDGLSGGGGGRKSWGGEGAAASWAREADAAQILATNWLLELRRERWRSRRSGQTHDYYILGLADSVTTVAVTPDDRVVLVRQFRAGSGRDHWETPGGLIHPGEDPRVAGPRELAEETGYRGDEPVVLGSVYTNPALVTSRMTMLLVANARLVGEPALDVGEEVEVGLFPRAEVRAMLELGTIDHALACLPLLLWATRPAP